MIASEPSFKPAQRTWPQTLSVTVWQKPDWLVALDAEVARLAQLSDEERQREWDALPASERAAQDDAYEQVMRDIAERRSRVTIFNPPGV
jgi:hypothetical protein